MCTRVICGLCGNVVKLSKSGAMPEHLRKGYVRGLWQNTRCNGVRSGLRIAKAAQANPYALRWHDRTRLRAIRFHKAGKSMENDSTQHWRLRYIQAHRSMWR